MSTLPAPLFYRTVKEAPQTLASYLGRHTTQVSRRGLLPGGFILFSLTWTPVLPISLSELIPSWFTSNQKAKSLHHPWLPHCTLCYHSLPPLIWSNFLLFSNISNSSTGIYGLMANSLRSSIAAPNISPLAWPNWNLGASCRRHCPWDLSGGGSLLLKFYYFLKVQVPQALEIGVSVLPNPTDASRLRIFFL